MRHLPLFFFYFSLGTVFQFPQVALRMHMIDHLNVSPASLTGLYGIVSFPWFAKPLYAFFSDSFPLCGYHKRPYVVLGSLLCSCVWFTMMYSHDSVLSIVSLLTASSFTLCVCDVIVDGVMVQQAQLETKKAKGQLLSFTRHITPMIENLLEDLGTTEEVKQQMQNPDIGLYSNNDLTLNLNKPPTEENTLTDIKASVHLYSKEAAARLAELLRLHPKLVEPGEQQKHIWSMTVQCTKSITAAQKKALEYLTGFLEKSMECLVSSSANGHTLSIAWHWDHKKLGTSQLIDPMLEAKLKEMNVE